MGRGVIPSVGTFEGQCRGFDYFKGRCAYHTWYIEGVGSIRMDSLDYHWANRRGSFGNMVAVGDEIP